MSLKPLGLALTAAALVTPLIWFPDLARSRDSIALFSQFLGIWALIAMALTQIIATRLRPVEWIFGGLDRNYLLHKWLGIGAITAILLHDTIDAEMRGLGRETLLVEVAETAGELSLYGLLILGVITVATFIPYHLWRWTHKLMGAFFVAGSFHYLFILKPFSNGDPLALYVTTFCVLGVLAFCYRLLPAGLRPSYAYEVTAVDPTGAALTVQMQAKGRGMRHRAGQFAFVSFEGDEPHPFTISAAPQPDRALRVTMAALGDYIRRLPQRLQPGTRVRVEGPFGHFDRPRKAAAEVWIAGGIGITPFLAWAEAKQDDTPVTLFYCIRNIEQAPHVAALQAIAEGRPELTLHLQTSGSAGRLSVDQILKHTQTDPAQITVSFCGPKAMREELRKGFAGAGLPARRFRYEEFEIRSGIGLRTLALWLRKRLNA